MWRYNPTPLDSELWHSNKGSHWYQHTTGKWDKRAAYAKGQSNPEAVSRLQSSLKHIHYKEFDRLMSAEQVAREKRGACHDQVMYEVAQLRKAGLNPRVKFAYETDGESGGATHTWVVYEDAGKLWWLENAWGGQEGLRSYKDEAAMLKDIRKRWDKNPDYPDLWFGDIDADKMKPGMDLGDILDLVDLTDFGEDT